MNVRTALFTIGYEGRALDELLGILAANKIDRLIDVRDLPLSRRRGFSKTPLGNAARAAGIEYLHLREAGNPFRKIRHDLKLDDLLGRYRDHLDGAAQAVANVADAVRGHRVALLCYEADSSHCHRGILAPRVAQQLGVRVKDL
ncbi:MAG: hypothetical protein JWO36_4569 [Myxococcales bacterium]|nr:hypothetical protein [Myxococcales bacterium]